MGNHKGDTPDRLLVAGVCARAPARAQSCAIRSRMREAKSFVHRLFDPISHVLGIGNPLRFYCTAVSRGQNPLEKP